MKKCTEIGEVPKTWLSYSLPVGVNQSESIFVNDRKQGTTVQFETVRVILQSHMYQKT